MLGAYSPSNLHILHLYDFLLAATINSDSQLFRQFFLDNCESSLLCSLNVYQLQAQTHNPILIPMNEKWLLVMYRVRFPHLIFHLISLLDIDNV